MTSTEETMKTSTLKRKLTAAMLCVGIVGAAQPASAQDNSVRDLIAANSGFLTTILLLTSASTVTYITQGLTDRLMDKAFSDTQRYMNNNAAALGQDISLGAGDTLDDLATIYDLPEADRPAFFERIHTQRHTLMPLVNKTNISREHARQFVFAVLTPEQLARYK
jgi:hypothetical protein